MFLHVLKFEFPATGSIVVYLLMVEMASADCPVIITKKDPFAVSRFLYDKRSLSEEKS